MPIFIISGAARRHEGLLHRLRAIGVVGGGGIFSGSFSFFAGRINRPWGRMQGYRW